VQNTARAILLKEILSSPANLSRILLPLRDKTRARFPDYPGCLVQLDKEVTKMVEGKEAVFSTVFASQIQFLTGSSRFSFLAARRAIYSLNSTLLDTSGFFVWLRVHQDAERRIDFF